MENISLPAVFFPALVVSIPVVISTESLRLRGRTTEPVCSPVELKSDPTGVDAVAGLSSRETAVSPVILTAQVVVTAVT